jgi:WD40 repeat protein
VGGVMTSGTPRAAIDYEGLEVVRELDSSGNQTVIESHNWSKRYGPPMWSPDGKNLLLSTYGDEDQGVEVRSAGPGVPLLGHWQSGPSADEDIEAFALSSDGRRAVTIGRNGIMVIRDASTGVIQRVVHAPADIKDLAWSYQVAALNADATTAAIIAGPISGTHVHGTVKLVNLETGGSHTIGGEAADGVTFSGEYLLVQRSSGVLEVWDAAGTHLQRSIPGEPNYEVAPVANSQGTLVARKRSDGTVSITDLRSGEPVGTFRLPSFVKVGMAFAPNGRTLLTVTVDLATLTGQLQQWNLSESAWVQIACRSVGRNLTAMEWQRYVGGAPPRNLRCG